VTTATLVSHLKARPDDSDLADIRATLLELSKDGRLPPPRTLGNRLAKVRGRVSGGNSLNFTPIHGNRTWFVKSAILSHLGGSGDLGDSVSNPHAKKWSDNSSTKK
jgi:hypothetical protein